jgi:hypothetical protein
LFGLQRDKKPNRIERLKETHPRLYSYCMNGGFVDADGFWKPTKDGLGMKPVIEYIEKHYGASMRQNKLGQKRKIAEGLQTAHNTPMAGEAPQICEAQTSP